MRRAGKALVGSYWQWTRRIRTWTSLKGIDKMNNNSLMWFQHKEDDVSEMFWTNNHWRCVALLETHLTWLCWKKHNGCGKLQRWLPQTVERLRKYRVFCLHYRTFIYAFIGYKEEAKHLPKILTQKLGTHKKIAINDAIEISQLKEHLCYYFQSKGLGYLK